ncbi:DNA alkylation repair protein [Streptococcus sp. NLN64]|uniref:DNA alkylation repair protein n=1 Tax=Streptococcus sp. NLN64 TaxID=2822799 RepID=UPI0018CA4966|nr:DNA alkylation repair protein [Streptococcus sp. NLN64]MBG9368120.1 DNA alkylation repair protein [Streptococcus sp. NLN64]
MANLKDIYSEEKLQEIVTVFASVESTFPKAEFLAAVGKEGWDSLSLRQRHERLARALVDSLNRPFEAVAPFLQEVGARVQGFSWLFLPDVVALYGLENFQDSMETLAILTESSSAEFAIRPFLAQNFPQTFEQMKSWSVSENEHHRRLASEGLRPNLPWGKKIPGLEVHRLKIWELLEELKGDGSLYVRKSVANHLNDWTRTHPEEVLDLLESWQGTGPETDWIIKRAARNLLKAGQHRALALFGYRSREDVEQVFWSFPQKIKKGDRMVVDYKVRVGQAGPLRLELQIDFVKATGKQSTKIFMLRDREAAEIEGQWRYDWLDKTTRRHANGPHELCLLLNGQILAEGVLEVTGFGDKEL